MEEEQKTMTYSEYEMCYNAAVILNKKSNLIVEILLKKGIFTPEEAESVYKISPFNQ